jgi:hypothetical protein
MEYDKQIWWHADLCVPALQRAHEWWRGERIGEASHPGPPGGAAATRRKREEKNEDASFNVMGMDLASLVKPLIEKVMKEIVTKLLTSNGLDALVGSLSGGRAVKKVKRAKRKKRRGKQTSLEVSKTEKAGSTEPPSEETTAGTQEQFPAAWCGHDPGPGQEVQV